jgi:hypothetical protein
MTTPDLINHHFPFYRLGLTRNPFGTLSQDEWLAVTVLPTAVEHAVTSGVDHLIVLGERGRGKSTTLHYLQAHYAAQGHLTAYERLPRGQWRYHTHTAPLNVFLLDEAQRLAPWQATRLFQEQARYGLRLVIGTHRAMTLGFRLRGLDVQTVRLERAISRERLAAILQRRLDVFAYADGPYVHFAPDTVDWLWATFRDDLRTMNLHLYGAFQRLSGPGPVTQGHVE